jgi:hypothetical protein
MFIVKKLHSFSIEDRNKARNIESNLDSFDNNSSFDKNSILENINSLKNKTRNININLSNGNKLSLRAEQLAAIINKSNDSKELETYLLDIVYNDYANINISKGNKEILTKKIDEIEKITIEHNNLAVLKKLLEETYHLDPKTIVKIQKDNIIFTLTAKDLNEVISSNNNFNDLSVELSNKVREYNRKESIKEISTLAEKLSENAKKQLNGEKFDSEIFMPYHVTPNILKALAFFMIPPIGLYYTIVAIVNAARNGVKIIEKLNDQIIKKDIFTKINELN